MSVQHLNYSGNVTHLVGEKLRCPYFRKGGSGDLKTWVITDGVYNPDTNKTQLELDEVSGG